MRIATMALIFMPTIGVAHATSAPHLHAEHGASWLFGVALIAAVAGFSMARARSEHRK